MASNDPNFGSVVALLHGDGVNNGTVFTDVIGKAITRNGNVVTNTGTKKYGTASCYFDGASDSLSLAPHSSLDLIGDFAIECWVYCSDLTANRGVYYQGNGADTDRLQITIYTDGHIAVFSRTTTQDPNFDVASSAGVIAAGSWYHIAASKSGSTVRLFVNGTQVASGTSAGTMPSGYAPHWGKSRTGSTDRWMLGYIDDMRITKGVARYTESFTPPTGPFPDYGRYVAGTIVESTGHSAFIVRSYRADNGALLGEVEASITDSGAYEVPCAPGGVDYSGPVMVACFPKFGSKWSAGAAKALGDLAFPTNPIATPYVYQCGAAGTTHASTEPAWPVVVGNTVSDGTVSWSCVDRMDGRLKGPILPAI